MKTAKDPRHKLRIETIKKLFAESFAAQGSGGEDFIKIENSLAEIDSAIEKAAPAWPIDKLNRIDLAILRYAVYELLKKDTPPKVVMDEAIEIAKVYGGENAPSFINGVLGTIMSTFENKNKE